MVNFRVMGVLSMCDSELPDPKTGQTATMGEAFGENPTVGNVIHREIRQAIDERRQRDRRLLI
jgi:hypothetical protein